MKECPDFPGVWKRKAADRSVEVFHLCRCAQCESLWPRPRDVESGELIEFACMHGVVIGRVLRMFIQARMLQLEVEVHPDSRVQIEPSLLTLNRTNSLWRVYAPAKRVLVKTRYRRAEVL